jgi:hypothetical protein
MSQPATTPPVKINILSAAPSVPNTSICTRVKGCAKAVVDHGKKYGKAYLIAIAALGLATACYYLIKDPIPVRMRHSVGLVEFDPSPIENAHLNSALRTLKSFLKKEEP